MTRPLAASSHQPPPVETPPNPACDPPQPGPLADQPHPLAVTHRDQPKGNPAMSSPRHPTSPPPLFQPPINTAETVRGSQQATPDTPATDPTDPPRELLRVEDAAARLAIGRTYMFALLRDQIIDSVKVGRLRRVPADAITTYITSLATDQRPATA